MVPQIRDRFDGVELLLECLSADLGVICVVHPVDGVAIVEIDANMLVVVAADKRTMTKKKG